MQSWQPGASPALLRARAQLLRHVRQFFAERQVMEVETPLLCSSGVTDPALEPLCVKGADAQVRYLQTSPEYAMKRLLAAGSGDIYQICKAFRADELGRRHNPEYTLLEWYRLGFDHHQLLREVVELVDTVLPVRGWQVWPWATLFQTVLEIDPLQASDADLRQLAEQQLGYAPPVLARDGLFDLLMSHVIEPAIADWGLVFVVDYPSSQAALARCFERAGQQFGARFECYLGGMELANGYWEAASASELAARFEADNALRRVRGQPTRPVDPHLLAALEAGLPDCAGVALGLDRLLMCQQGVETIGETLAFDWTRA